jgi:nitronate monooxygenase
MGGFGALMSSPAAMADWVAGFRSRSNGAFQINLWIPDPAPVRDAAHEARVRERLERLAGIAVPDPGPGPFVQDFAAQLEALLAAGPVVASCIMGVFPPEIAARLADRGITWFANATTVAEARAAEAAGALRWWRRAPRPAGTAAASTPPRPMPSPPGSSPCCRRWWMRSASR